MVHKGKTRRRRKNAAIGAPEEIRRVTGGFYRAEIEGKTCGECGEIRSSVDSSGVCGYCRSPFLIK